MDNNVEKIQPVTKIHEVLILGTNESLIREIGEKTKGLVISDKKTFESVKQARTEIVTIRTSIDKARKTANETHRDAITNNNQKAHTLTLITSEYEEPLQTQVKNWQEKTATEKRINEEAECARIAAHTRAINVIRDLSLTHANAPVKKMQCLIDHYSTLNITDEVFEEYAIEARQVLKQSLISLDIMLVAAKNRESETERQAEAQIRLDKQQEKLDEQRELQEAEDERIKAQREELEKQQRESNEKAEREQAAKDRLEREDALRPDKENLFDFAEQIRALSGPDVDSDEASFIIECALKELGQVADIIHQQCENL